VWHPETVDSAWQRQYCEDAQQLGELGAALIGVEIPRVAVRIPRTLAEKALAAWQRDADDGPADPETFEQRTQRHRAATLGLIGLAIESSGHWTDDYVVVDLGADLVGAAVAASDDLPVAVPGHRAEPDPASPLILGELYDGSEGPTIMLVMLTLAAGDWLQDTFRNLARHKEPLMLTASPQVRVVNVVAIEMVCVADGPRIALRSRDIGGDRSFVWSATVEGWLYLADLVQPLCDGAAGHQYLTEHKDDAALIELSSGEPDVLRIAQLNVR
jgi:hypothetical protein